MESQKEKRNNDLFRKYDTPAPRYTSYPTVPAWEVDKFSRQTYLKDIKRAFDQSNDTKGVSLYLHLPFCENLCTYCACTTRITKNHSVEIPYIQALLKEWEFYKSVFGRTPTIRELHLGGGTPTFFSALNLQWLISYLLEGIKIHEDFAFSFEGHPNNTSWLQLKTLFDLGFRRVSFGVQDLNLKVQKAINRIQPYENLKSATEQARAIGYTSISYDLIYGLPFQNPDTVSDTVDKVLALRPDRIAFYSYAHVPWIKPGQRGYEDADLPSGSVKRNLYEIGREKLILAGYEDIGMDHFALRHDELYKAHARGVLHRNFMGYTTSNSDLLVGLGASAISDAKNSYGQNIKKVEDYRALVKEHGNAIAKGHNLGEEDVLIGSAILDIACRGELNPELLSKVIDEDGWQQLKKMEAEGILYLDENGLKVTGLGKPFVRNICKVFDKYAVKTDNQLFSKAI